MKKDRKNFIFRIEYFSTDEDMRDYYTRFIFFIFFSLPKKRKKKIASLVQILTLLVSFYPCLQREQNMAVFDGLEGELVTGCRSKPIHSRDPFEESNRVCVRNKGWDWF